LPRHVWFGVSPPPADAPHVVTTARQINAAEAAAYDKAQDAASGESIRAMTPAEGFFAFNPAGRIIGGVGTGLGGKRCKP
jgi:hypothetical protein